MKEERCSVLSLTIPTSLRQRSRFLLFAQNLGRNSSKFVQRGFIRLHCFEAEEDGSVCLAVEDSGPGISPEKQDRLFDKVRFALLTVKYKHRFSSPYWIFNRELSFRF